MNKQPMFWIKIVYWIGIFADGFWAILLLCPPLFGIITSTPNFAPDLQMKIVMGIGGSLMTGWTVLLIWAVRKPIERRGVILITAFPVVTGIFIFTLIGYLNGDSSNLWILIKTATLFVLAINSYILTGKIKKEKNQKPASD